MKRCSTLQPIMFRSKYRLTACICCLVFGCHAPPSSVLTIYRIQPIKDSSDHTYRRLTLDFRQEWEQLDRIVAYSPVKCWQTAQSTIPILSNWVADAMYYSSEKLVGRAPDLVLVPVGREYLQLPRGNITCRDLYRLFPGHYRWELRQLTLHAVEQLFDSTFPTLSWGISSGTKITRKPGQQFKISCRGVEIDSASRIDVMMLRDMWEVKDPFSFLLEHPLILQGNNLHDFIISYCKSFTIAGIPLRISTEKRIHIYD